MLHRQTKQRQAILEALERHGGHLTADQIYALVKPRFPRLSLGTVYRNLRVLIAQGNVRELDFGIGFSHFEVAKEAHYHFICRACGRIEDAALPVREHFTALAKRAVRARGFRIEDHRLDFIGLCLACQRTKRSAGKRVKKP
jgi:Fur family peroxide stress response transcriptional regulator